MPRISGVAPERASLLTRLAYRFAQRMVGKVPEPMTIQAHNAEIFRAVAGFEFFLGRAHTVPKRLKTLAAMKASTQVGCPF
jgi:hypothetical protein